MFWAGIIWKIDKIMNKNSKIQRSSSPTAAGGIDSNSQKPSSPADVRCSALVRCRQISNLSIHRNKSHWTFTFYDKKGTKCSRVKLESNKIKPLIKYLNMDTISPYYSEHLDECLSSE